MNKLFDFHFHFLFKHYISIDVPLSDNIETKGLAKILDEIFGGPFASQSSPKQVGNSKLFLGVAALLSVEHAYANRILRILGINFSKGLPINPKILKDTREGEVSYYDEFKKQVDFYVKCKQELSDSYKISFLNRNDTEWKGKGIDAIATHLKESDERFLTFSIEGGHNLSNVLIRKGVLSRYPELQLKEIQDSSDLDFISINLSHLSYIPEQPLSSFAQGVNRISQIAFHSEDFVPRNGLGITELGRKVIRQAHFHSERPILLDLKHMSAYSRFQYYRWREKLINENAVVERLPIISSHTGFTFTSMSKYLADKKFKSFTSIKDGKQLCSIVPANRRIGRTDDFVNGGLYCNPWSINLFDEEIIEIMQSKGMIGIILDQRVLGAASFAIDSKRGVYFEEENLSFQEWRNLFESGSICTEESIIQVEGIAPRRPERHIMLFCFHIIYAVRIGYIYLNWIEGTSPWDCICLGSDFDGLINPINGFENIEKLNNIDQQLKKYLPQADKYLKDNSGVKALKYNDDGTVNNEHLDRSIDAFLYQNGVQFISRFLGNWQH